MQIAQTPSQMSLLTSGYTHQFIFWLHAKVQTSQISCYILFRQMEVVCRLSGRGSFPFLTHHWAGGAELASGLQLPTAPQLLGDAERLDPSPSPEEASRGERLSSLGPARFGDEGFRLVLLSWQPPTAWATSSPTGQGPLLKAAMALLWPTARGGTISKTKEFCLML